MKVYEALTEALVAEGMDRFFGLMTNETVVLINHMAKLGIPMIRSRTEGGAIGMADGYARATREPAVAIVGAGPGATPGATSLVTARNRRSPLVLLAGEQKPGAHPRKALDLETHYATLAGFAVTLKSWETLGDAVHRVYEHVSSGEGPAVLILPQDVVEDAIIGAFEYEPAPRAFVPPLADEEALAEAADALARATKPVILAGRGAAWPGTREALEEVGERAGALLATTIQAPGLFAGHPWAMRHVGSLGTQTGQDLLAEADCLLAVGTSIDSYMSDNGQLFPKAKVIHVDVRADAIGKLTRADIGLVGDAEATTRRLGERLAEILPQPREGYRTPDVAERLAADPGKPQVTYTSSERHLDPRELCDVLDELLPQRRVIVTDTGHSILFAAQHIGGFDSPHDRFWTSDFGAVGSSLAPAIGVAMARPDQATTVLLGDGAFMMTLHELDTAARERVGLTVVVMNNEEFGSEVRHLVKMGESPDLARFPSPDIAGVATALGCEAVTVRTKGELVAAAARIGTTSVPFVIDARIDPEVVHPARG